MDRLIERVSFLRSGYRAIKNALPWLDASVREEDELSFKGFAHDVTTLFVKAADLVPSLKGSLHLLKERSIGILRFNPSEVSLNECNEIFSEMISTNMILSMLHTDITFEELMKLAGDNPHLKILLESGPRKILYYIQDIKKALGLYDNLYLCTFNFCNWYGHEEICRLGLGKKLIYGSHMPEYSADASMGPVIMSDIDWETKCDIAGNNLRRLLGMVPLKPGEIRYKPAGTFIIDSHAHNLQPGRKQILKMPTPDMNFHAHDWTDFMNLCSVEKIFLTPVEMLLETNGSNLAYVQDLIDYSPERFFFYEILHPGEYHESIGKLKKSLVNPNCIGIKIHPTFHKTNADDDSYESVYRIAEEFSKPIMTHSWEISSYNPEQYRSHPDRFRRFLKLFSNIPFILGHAGGRPSAFDATVSVCRDFPNVLVDLAGDYYNNGLIDILADRIGADRILFASDVDWMDTRCNLGPVLSSHLTDEDVLKILRTNALRVFHVSCSSTLTL